MIFRLIILSSTLFVAGALAAGSEFHVAPSGSDSADGSRAHPFATLTRARDVIRTAPRPATVWIAGGDYLLKETFALTAEDSGTADAPVVWRAEPGQTPRLLGASRLAASDFQPITDTATLARIAPAARDRIVALDLSALGVTHKRRFKDVFGDTGGLVDLFVNGRREALARYPNQGSMTIERVLENAGGPTGKDWSSGNWPKPPANGPGALFVYREEFAARHALWARQLDRGVWIRGYWRIPWQSEAVRIGEIDTSARTVRLARPVANGVGNKYTRPAGNGKEPYWALNLLEEIDRPGEWCVDFTDDKLYYWPSAPLENSEVLLADRTEPVVSLTDAAFVTLRGLTIEANLGPGVVVRGGSDVLLAGNTVRNVDAFAIRIERGFRHTVLSNDLYHLGEGGVWLSGGDEKATPRVPAAHRVVNNHIHHFSELIPVYTPGVNSGYSGAGGGGHHEAVGMYVAHNFIHDTPHGGVLFGSWDSTFEFNEVSRYCLVSDDLGAFYAYDKFGRFGGHTFRHNLMHSSPVGDGIYFDLDHPDMTLEGNIAYLRSGTGRGTGFLYKIGSQAKNPQTIRCVNNVSIMANVGFEFVSALPDQSVIANNVVVQAARSPNLWWWVKGEKRVRAQPYPSGANAVYATPEEAGFVNVARHDFRLRPDAAILRDLPDFKPIPADKIGLFLDEYRLTLPSDAEAGRFLPTTANGTDILDRD